MTSDEQYRKLAKQLSEIAREHQRVFTEINSTFDLAKSNIANSIQPLLDELNTVRAFKIDLPPIHDLMMSPALEATRTANLAISELLDSPKFGLLSEELTKASVLWKDHIAPLSLASQSIGTSLLGIQSELSRTSQISVLSERILSTINFAELGLLSNITTKMQHSIRSAHFAFSESYSELFKSFEDAHAGILSVPPMVSSLPPIDFYFGNRFLQSITISQYDDLEEDDVILADLQREVKDDIVSHLSLLDNSLIKLWEGAVGALRSDNPDSVLHSSISLRELLTHVLHKLAPDQKVREWTNLPDMFHKGKPTRRARLLYICRNVNSKPFSNFLNKDIEATLASFEVFQEGTHSVNPDISSRQLDLLRIRTESCLRILIRTHFDASGA